MLSSMATERRLRSGSSRQTRRDSAHALDIARGDADAPEIVHIQLGARRTHLFGCQVVRDVDGIHYFEGRVCDEMWITMVRDGLGDGMGQPPKPEQIGAEEPTV